MRSIRAALNDAGAAYELSSRLLLAALAPLLWLQSQHVRRKTPRLPEALGPRHGQAGIGPCIKILVLGDSGAAGVGVEQLTDGLSGQLVALLSEEFCIEWTVIATNGLDSPGMIRLLEVEPATSFDVVILSIGANDATALCLPKHWSILQDRVADLIESRFSPKVLIHSAVPPMHSCKALPQPLRWFMGRWAREMNLCLEVSILKNRSLRGHGLCLRSIHCHPETTTRWGMSADGIHPSEKGYAAWARTLILHVREQLVAD
jgi:lysophospholipase L1-like esterase